MNADLRDRVDALAGTAGEFAKANLRRNVEHDWMSEAERRTLDNLRAAFAALEREEARQQRVA